jgi:hypothetical protein
MPRFGFNPLKGSLDLMGSATTVPKLVQLFDCTTDEEVGDLVRISAANTVSKVTSNDALEIPNGIFGVGFSKPTTTSINILFTGIVGGYLALTAGDPVFVGSDGSVTQTKPLTGMVQQLGFAVSATEVFFNLQQAFQQT